MDESEIHTPCEQEDHPRLYGTDYAEQLCEAGFMVAVRGMKDLLGQKWCARTA